MNLESRMSSDKARRSALPNFDNVLRKVEEKSWRNMKA